MPNPKALPPAAPAKLSVWSDQTGTPYLVQQQPDGRTTFTPLETALAQAAPPTTPERVTTYREPLNTLLLGLAVVLGFVLSGYLLGFSRRCCRSARRCRPSLTPLRHPAQQLSCSGPLKPRSATNVRTKS
jgi:hypothetical protein